MDILDSIDDILGEDNDFSTNVIEGEIVEDSIVLDDDTMTEEEARNLTSAIHSTAGALSALLWRAHEGKAYKALGYDTWKSYVETEFDFTVQRGYQLLDLAKVINALESASPDGTEISLTEAQARDIKRELPKITERVAEETVDKTPEEASDVVADIVDEVREKKREEAELQKEIDAIEQEKQQTAEEQAKQAEYDALEEQADDFLDEHGGLNGDADYKDDEYMVDSSISASDSAVLYSVYNLVESRSNLPDTEKVAQLIPDGEIDDMKKNAVELKEWLEEFISALQNV